LGSSLVFSWVYYSIKSSFFNYFYQKLVVLNYIFLFATVIGKSTQQLIVNTAEQDYTLFCSCQFFKQLEFIGLLYGGATDLIIAYTFFHVQYNGIKLHHFSLKRITYVAVPLFMIQTGLWVPIILSSASFIVTNTFCLVTGNGKYGMTLFSVTFGIGFCGPFLCTVGLLIASKVLQAKGQFTDQTKKRVKRKRVHLLFLCISYIFTNGFNMIMLIYYPIEPNERSANIFIIAVFIGNLQPLTHLVVNFIFLHLMKVKSLSGSTQPESTK